jgi:hypothetical protein
VAAQVFPLGDAARPEDRQGRHGAPAHGSFVLDVAPGMRYEQLKKFSPHAGQPGTGVGVEANTE